MEIELKSFFWHVALLILSKTYFEMCSTGQHVSVTYRDDNYVHSDSEHNVLMWLMYN